MPRSKFTACSNCGLPLAVAPGATTATCNACQNEQAIDPAVAGPAPQPELHAQLAALDGQLRDEQRSNLVSGRYGPDRPSAIGALGHAVGGCTVGVVLLVLGNSKFESHGIYLSIAGLLIMAYGMYSCIREFSKLSAYEAAEEKHRIRREKLMAEHASKEPEAKPPADTA